MLKRRTEKGKRNIWASGEDVFSWWLSDKKVTKQIKGQLTLLDYD